MRGEFQGEGTIHREMGDGRWGRSRTEPNTVCGSSWRLLGRGCPEHSFTSHAQCSPGRVEGEGNTQQDVLGLAQPRQWSLQTVDLFWGALWLRGGLSLAGPEEVSHRLKPQYLKGIFEL